MMTDEQHQAMNVAIAKAIPGVYVHWEGAVPYMSFSPEPNWEFRAYDACAMRDFCSSLDSMAAVERLLDQGQRVDYLNMLARVCGTEKDKVFATSGQRAESFCRVLRIGPFEEPADRAAVQT